MPIRAAARQARALSEMRYAGFTIIGLGLIAAACTMIGYCTYLITQIGICADGPQPFTIERRCPDGSTGMLLALFGAFPLLGAGALLHSQRGRAPGAEREPEAITFLLTWCGLFAALAFASFWGVWGADADPGGYTGTTATTKPAAISTGVLFSLLAIGGLVPLGVKLGERGSPTVFAPGAGQGSFDVPASRPPSAGPGTGASPSGGGTLGELLEGLTGERAAGLGRVERLERLERLRRSGTLSDAEFERLKQEIIEGRTEG